MQTLGDIRKVMAETADLPDSTPIELYGQELPDGWGVALDGMSRAGTGADGDPVTFQIQVAGVSWDDDEEEDPDDDDLDGLLDDDDPDEFDDLDDLEEMAGNAHDGTVK